MRRVFESDGRPRWRSLLIAALPVAILAGSASVQGQTRITNDLALSIQEEALALLATSRVSAMSAQAQTDFIESYVLYAFARDAQPGQATGLTPTEHNQAQRLIGAILQSAADTTPHTHATTRRHDHASTHLVVESPTPRYVQVAPPLPPPIVLAPAPAPVFFLNPTPAYVIPARHHKRGW